MKRTYSTFQQLADAADKARDALLGRYPRLPQTDPTVSGAVERRIISAVAAGDAKWAWQDVALYLARGKREGEHPPAKDVLGALTLYQRYRDRLDDDERLLIDMALRRGISWAEIARRLGLRSRDAAQRRYNQLVDWGAGDFQAKQIDPEWKAPTS